MKTSLIAVLAAALCAAWTPSSCAQNDDSTTDPVTGQYASDTATEISSPADARDALGNLAQEATDGNGGNAPDTTAPDPGPTKDE